jgi:uncharacterized protein YutE (UPF0331/DUF86 family)
MKNGVLTKKVAAIEETLGRLREHLPRSYEWFASDWVTQKMAERSLQVIIEDMLDIGERLVALQEGGPCATAAAVMERLDRMGVIQSAASYVPMVRFRNLLVHQYEHIDPAMVYGIAAKKLGDVEAFLQDIRRYVQSH